MQECCLVLEFAHNSNQVVGRQLDRRVELENQLEAVGTEELVVAGSFPLIRGFHSGKWF